MTDPQERAGVEAVFSLGGGELADEAWEPTYVTETYGEVRPVHFEYWYEGVPEYVESEFDNSATYRTTCRDESLGLMPSVVSDSAGTWRRVASYSTSGEVEHPEPPGEFIYIGDGWSEIVYKLDEAERLTPDDAGCYVDGHWGQYGPARVIELALAHRWEDKEAEDLATRHLASMGPSDSPDLEDNEHETLIGAADDAEGWLNDNVAPEGYSFGWHDGEFFLQSHEWWEEGE